MTWHVGETHTGGVVDVKHGSDLVAVVTRKATYAEARDIARLIAAAPDMAAMLKWLATDPAAGTFPDVQAHIGELLARIDGDEVTS
jgi:hypothetical protein